MNGLGRIHVLRYNGDMTKQDIKQAIEQGIQNVPHPDYIRRVRLFGSYLHGDAREDSDIDLLVDFSEPVSFFELYDIEQSLSGILGGKKVELTTPGGLSKFIRNEVLGEAEIIYEQE